MSTLNERGILNVLVVPLILVAILFFGAAGFGVWAFISRSDYKNNSDRKTDAAVASAVERTQAEDNERFAEESKKPYDTYIGPSAFGNITVNYPKTWSGYVVAVQAANSPVNAYFQPKIVPNVTDPEYNFALRVELVQQPYNSVLAQYEPNIKTGKATIAPYKLAKVPSVVGSRIEGQITPRKQGTMIVLPLRNMTLKVWTESNDFKGDLDTHILPNLSFIP